MPVTSNKSALPQGCFLICKLCIGALTIHLVGECVVIGAKGTKHPGSFIHQFSMY